MARKKKHPEHANHERWLVSYADFITLLFAFFVVMFAVSQVDTNKMGRFTESFKGALDWQVFDQGNSGILPDSPPAGMMNEEQQKAARVKAQFVEDREEIRKDLIQKAGAGGKLAGLKVLDVHGELVLRLPETLLFAVGQAEVQKSGQDVLEAIGAELRDRPVRVRVEGHTDATPIHTDRFPSNWELSTARATAVIEYWLETSHFDPSRLAAAGYGEWHPIASNDTVEGRAQNRRVDVIIVASGGGDDEDKTAKAPFVVGGPASDAGVNAGARADASLGADAAVLTADVVSGPEGTLVDAKDATAASEEKR